MGESHQGENREEQIRNGRGGHDWYGKGRVAEIYQH